ncbi:MAG: T9SS type A sorting domain-containing protein [Bacteroidales bacterium]|nr:T9SS type A sorting domain-containing protein [Bacteroidales bacterium]
MKTKQHQLFIYLLFMLLTLQSSAQDLFSKVFYHETEGIQTAAMSKTFDNNYILAGWTELNNAGLTIKFSETGELIWSKQILQNDITIMFSDIIATHDSCSLLCGNVMGDILLVKINAEGEIIWCKMTTYDPYATVKSISETNDHGFIMTGYTGSYPDNLYTIFVARFDSDGNQLWNNQYYSTQLKDKGTAVKQLPDNTFIVTGQIDSHNMFLMNLNEDGTVNWGKKLNNPENLFTDAFDVIVTEDNIYFYFIAYYAGNALLKTDLSGNILWSKSYQLSFDNMASETRPRIIQTNDGSILLVNSNFFGGKLFKVDSSGELAWMQSLELLASDVFPSISGSNLVVGNGPLWGVKRDDIRQPQIGIIKTDSIGYEAMCTQSDFNPESFDYPSTLEDISFTVNSTGTTSEYIVEVIDINLLEQEGCVTFIGAVDENKPDISPLLISPNPAKNTFRIEYDGMKNQLFQQVEIKDALGRTVYSTTDPACLENGMSTEGLKPGIYHVRLTTNKAYFVGRLIISD